MVDLLQPQDYVVVAAGLDWLTATAKNSECSLQLERVADIETDRQRLQGAVPLPQARLGFEGYKLEQFYFGRREHDVMIQATGELADLLGAQIIPLASNVSRLDMQVTVWTEGEVIELAHEEFKRFESGIQCVGRPSSYSITIGRPKGQTFYINSRWGDNFGRIYDKGVQAKIAEAGCLWRYEIELKRDVATQRAREYVRAEQPSAYTISQVHSWMTKRGVRPRFKALGQYADVPNDLPVSSQPILTWFEDSLSITIAKAIEKFGLEAVLKSLRLQNLVQAKEQNHGCDLPVR